MSKNKLPRLSEAHRQAVLATLTRDRLWKYLKACGNDEHMSLRLYVLNTKVSAAFLMDLHYVEVALRNKFDGVLTVAYTDQWFTNPGFLTHLKPAGLQNLTKAQSAANKGRPQGTPVPRGKVIAELTFGFWLTLTDRHLEVPLWTPCLHKVFHNGRPPKRSKFNACWKLCGYSETESHTMNPSFTWTCGRPIGCSTMWPTCFAPPRPM